MKHYIYRRQLIGCDVTIHGLYSCGYQQTPRYVLFDSTGRS